MMAKLSDSQIRGYANSNNHLIREIQKDIKHLKIQLDILQDFQKSLMKIIDEMFKMVLFLQNERKKINDNKWF